MRCTDLQRLVSDQKYVYIMSGTRGIDKLEIAGIPAVLYGKRSRRVYLYVHGKNGSAAEAARFARTACPAGWQVLAVDLPEHGTRKNSPEKLVPWVVTRELQAVYARMQPVWKHIRVYGVSIGAWFAMQALQTQTPEKALLVSPVVDKSGEGEIQEFASEFQ